MVPRGINTLFKWLRIVFQLIFAFSILKKSLLMDTCRKSSDVGGYINALTIHSNRNPGQ
jgi:hypothetical protein